MLIFDHPNLLYVILPAVIFLGSLAALWWEKRKPGSPGSSGLVRESSLLQAEAGYRDLFENANDAIFILDEKHNYVEVNRRAVALFGFSREEFLKLNVKDVIPPEQSEKSQAEFAKLGNSGAYERFVGRMRTRDGRWLDIEVNSSAIVRDGLIIGSRDIVRDITERRKAEAEKERLIAELRKALEEIKSLKGIIPICSFCKRVRIDKDYWEQVDIYIQNHSEAEISHGICQECLKSHYPDYAEDS